MLWSGLDVEGVTETRLGPRCLSQTGMELGRTELGHRKRPLLV